MLLNVWTRQTLVNKTHRLRNHAIVSRKAARDKLVKRYVHGSSVEIY